jgi:putative acetyltransferase
MNYKIRSIEKRDDKAVEAVIRSCLIEFGADHEGTAWADPDLCRFSEIYCTEGNAYWVAEDEGGRIVGGVGIGALDSYRGLCELQKMYCLPEARGTGLAHELIALALDYARPFYKSVYLETLPNMHRAQRFYGKHGFRRCGAIGNTSHFACDVRYIKDLEDENT